MKVNGKELLAFLILIFVWREFYSRYIVIDVQTSCTICRGLSQVCTCLCIRVSEAVLLVCNSATVCTLTEPVPSLGEGGWRR